MDRHYVGFKRITINAPNWKSTEAPTITCDSQDWDGRCLHLGADAFLEFENTVRITWGGPLSSKIIGLTTTSRTGTLVDRRYVGELLPLPCAPNHSKST